VCYLEYEKKPGLYLCLNRDTGELHKFTVGYNNEYINGYERINTVMTFEDIIDKINIAELHVNDGKLPDIQYSDDNPQCQYCSFKYLCVKDEGEEITEELHIPDLIEAATMYKRGTAMFKEGSQLKKEGVRLLLEHSKLNKKDKFKTGGVSFTYRGMISKLSISNIEELKNEAPSWLVEKYIKQGEPYDDYSVRVLKEKLE